MYRDTLSYIERSRFEGMKCMKRQTDTNMNTNMSLEKYKWAHKPLVSLVYITNGMSRRKNMVYSVHKRTKEKCDGVQSILRSIKERGRTELETRDSKKHLKG